MGLLGVGPGCSGVGPGRTPAFGALSILEMLLPTYSSNLLSHVGAHRTNMRTGRLTVGNICVER